MLRDDGPARSRANEGLGHERSLVRVAADQAGTSLAVMSELARELLGEAGWWVDRRPSTPSVLNNDGSPLQACVSCSPRGIGVRLIADPCVGARDMEARVAGSVGVLTRLLRRKRGAGLERPCRETIRLGLPPAERRSELHAGALWLAAGPADPGAALYVTCGWGEPAARWPRVDAWLDAVLADGRPARRALAALRMHAQPVSLGIEGAGSGIRAKLYARLERLVPLARLGLEPLCDPALARFLSMVIGEGSVSSHGLVLCASFRAHDGSLADAKLDLCAHCLPRAPAAWSSTVTALARALSLPVPGAVSAVADGTVEVALLGLGVDAGGLPRLNVYLKCR